MKAKKIVALKCPKCGELLEMPENTPREPRKKRKWRKYDKEEIDYIKQWYPTASPKSVAKGLGRDKKSVIRKASTLGVTS